MRRGVRFALVGAAAAAAGAAACAEPSTQLSTSKGVEPFAQCFTAAQDRAGRAWAFVPKESGGGTFSNLGAVGVRQPYFVEVADRGQTRQIRVSTPGADRLLVLAVQHCI